jgi:mRNA interferase MazF
VCPITTAARGWPIHVSLPGKSTLTGFIMVEQIKSIDYNTRNAKYIDKAKEETLSEVLAILDAIIYE